jgi:hypothetical protein
MTESTKYPRSLHAKISLGSTSDDRFMPDGYVKAFSEINSVVLLEKLDGENNLFSKHGLFARSHTAPTISPWTKPLRDRWELIKNDLGNLELFGEGMFGVHSIGYKNLESFYYLFGVRENGRWLSWEEVKFYAALFDFPTVPEIPITITLKDFYKEGVDENKQLQEWFKANLGMYWHESINTPGMLSGYDLETDKPASEGFVFRNADSFETNDGVIPVMDNEFNNLFKVVRPGHVKTDEHWTKNWTEANLTDYHKYNWSAYEFLSKKKAKEDQTKHENYLKETIFGYEDIGRTIRYQGEHGVLTLLSSTRLLEKGELDCVIMRWDTAKKIDGEEYCGGNWMPEFVDEPYMFKHINQDGTLKKK